MQGISWLAEDLLASQEVMFFMESYWIIYLVCLLASQLVGLVLHAVNQSVRHFAC
jgi:hypothetical protein